MDNETKIILNHIIDSTASGDNKTWINLSWRLKQFIDRGDLKFLGENHEYGIDRLKKKLNKDG